MLLNCLRRPLQTLNRIHATLVHRTITANLEQAREYAANDNREGFERHCGHAERLAERHAPERVEDVERIVAAGPNLFDESIDTNQQETVGRTVNV